MTRLNFNLQVQKLYLIFPANNLNHNSHHLHHTHRALPMADETSSKLLEKLKRQGEELENLIQSSLDLEDEEFFGKITTPLVGPVWFREKSIKLTSPI